MSSESQSHTKSSTGRASPFAETASTVENPSPSMVQSMQERAKETFDNMRGSLSIERKGDLDRDPALKDTLNDFDDASVRPVDREV